jgi:hypothetical protein
MSQTILRIGNGIVAFLCIQSTYDKILGGRGISINIGFIKTLALFLLGVVLIVTDFKAIPAITNKAPWLSTNNGRAGTYLVAALLGAGEQTIILVIAAFTVYLGYNGTSYPKAGGSWF